MKPILPGGTIGILGGGQLGRMLAVEARRMGYRTIVLDPAPDGPASQASDEHIQAPLTNLKAARLLAERSDVLTMEWELIPAETLEEIEKLKPLYPNAAVLRVIADRLTQKEFLTKGGFAQAPYAAVSDLSSLENAASKIGFPCILKRRRAGYDGKGQQTLNTRGDLPAAAKLLQAPCVLEQKISFRMEISVILARGRDGKTSAYPIAKNVHRGGILHTTVAPARIPASIEKKARALAAALAKKLGHVGVMAVELFLLKDGTLLVNEIAPRVHNSGHFTLGACAVSQFEQHLRAVCSLPLSSGELLSPSVMVNLLGELWDKGEPRWEKVLKNPNARLHLYGKKKAAPGRKMGHVLLLGKNTKQLLRQAESLIKALKN